MRYYIADCHFYHKNLLTEMDNRDFESVEQMNEVMIEKWNKKVHARDEVVILGDLSLGNGKETNEILCRLKGRLYLIRGNHDERYLRDKDFDISRFEWVKDYAEEITIGEDFDVEAKADSCLKFYNKFKSKMNADVSPEDGGGDNPDASKYLKEVIKRAGEKAKSEGLNG